MANNKDFSYHIDLGRARREPLQPILQSRQGDAYWWEENGVFNPGVAEYGGKVILLYRAYDKFHISRFGLAESVDGIKFQRFALPSVDTDPDDSHERLGIEDPRITKIGNTYYIFHTSASYHRVDHPPDVSGTMEHMPWRVRVGLRTTTDFSAYQKYGVIIPDIPAKNACLFPEKIDGRFAILYREHTHPEGEEVEVLKLAFSDNFFTWNTAHTVQWPQAEEWQEGKFGLGSSPISIPKGFLIVYHAVDANRVYRLGLMLLDRDDPTKIIWVSKPILEPEMPYEKEGFTPNVVYCCGALLRGNELWIYYGAADQVIGRAVMPIATLLEA